MFCSLFLRVPNWLLVVVLFEWFLHELTTYFCVCNNLAWVKSLYLKLYTELLVTSENSIDTDGPQINRALVNWGKTAINITRNPFAEQRNYTISFALSYIIDHLHNLSQPREQRQQRRCRIKKKSSHLISFLEFLQVPANERAVIFAAGGWKEKYTTLPATASSSSSIWRPTPIRNNYHHNYIFNNYKFITFFPSVGWVVCLFLVHVHNWHGWLPSQYGACFDLVIVPWHTVNEWVPP